MLNSHASGERGQDVPKSVKVFVWLGVVYVLFGAALLAWSVHGIYEPSEGWSHLSVHLRESMQRNMLDYMLRTFAIHTAIFGMLAGLAAFARQNWARWALAVYFVLVFVDRLPGDLFLYFTFPRGFAAVYGDVAGWWQNFLQVHVPSLHLGWPYYIATAWQVAFVVLIFSPNARPWFRRNAATSE